MKGDEDGKKESAQPQTTNTPSKSVAFKSSLAAFIANFGALSLYQLEAIKTRLQGTIFFTILIIKNSM